MQRYSANFRGLNRIKQQEQVRPKYYSIYNFSETGQDTGRIAPLPAVGYYKEKMKQESRWMMKTHVTNSPKWSWIIANHYERQNTYLRGRAILPRYKNYVVLKRLETAAKENGLSGAEQLIKYLRIAGTKFEPEILQQLAIYEPSTFTGLCELAVRTEIDCVWESVRNKENMPEQAQPYDVEPENRIAFNSVTPGMKKLHE